MNVLWEQLLVVGTSFSIDHTITAALLGFEKSCNNALDAVASRDFSLRLLSSMSLLGTLLSRIGQDYQLWTTREFGFFDLPDNLCGGSSMMPQKKNPYLLEIIKGKASSINGILMQGLTAMHNVSFGNSFEVGTEALKGAEIVLKNIIDIVTLVELIVKEAVPIEEKMKQSIHNGLACTSGVAEILVQKKKTPFRQVHYDIGKKITDAIEKKEDTNTAILELMDEKLKNKKPIFWADINEHGAGTGKNAIKKAYKNASSRLKENHDWITAIEKKWRMSDNQRHDEIKKIIK